MKILKVASISGDYANLVDESGEELFIAIALLPFGVDIDDTLMYDGIEFTVQK